MLFFFCCFFEGLLINIKIWKKKKMIQNKVKKPGQEIVRPAQSLTGLTSDQREVNQSSLFASFSSLTNASFHALPCSHICKLFLFFASFFSAGQSPLTMATFYRFLWQLFIHFASFFCRTITADYGHFLLISMATFYSLCFFLFCRKKKQSE